MLKNQVMKMCREVIAVLDATKWGRVGLASFARMEDIHAIITDQFPPAGLSERAAALGIKINTV